MVWIALTGIALEVVGLSLAVIGVSETYRESLNRNLWRDVRGDLAAWFRRTILRRPHDRSVTLGVASSTLGHLSQQAFVQVRPPKPADDAPPEEQIAYLARYVEVLSDEMTGVREYARTLTGEAERKASARFDELSARVDSTSQSLTSLHAALVGIDGSGLRRAAVGLRVTLVGVVLSVAGLSW